MPRRPRSGRDDASAVAGVPFALAATVGVLHEASTGRRHSLHLTIGVPRITYRDVIRRWLDSLALDGLDAPVPIAHHDGVAMTANCADRFAAIACAAGSVASDPDLLEAIAASEARRQRERRPGELSGRLAVTADPPAVEAGTLLRRREGVQIEVAGQPDERGRCVVRAGATTLRMPWSLHTAMTQVRDAPTVDAPALAPLGEASALVLLRRLVREGVLVPA